MRATDTGVRSRESAARSVRAPARTFEDLVVWQKAHAWVLEFYRFTDAFPTKEAYGLAAQFRRASISIPAHIAGGFKKSGVAGKKRYVNVARGSLVESRCRRIVARDLGYCDVSELLPRLEEVGRLLDACARAIAAPAPYNPSLPTPSLLL